MKITIFGLTISSSWGNGHATPYRAIVRALHRMGHEVVFYEKNVPYYAKRRDFNECDFCRLVLYSDWETIRIGALTDARESDAVINASYCPEGARICNEVLDIGGPLHVFYDLDTPITLESLKEGEIEYLRADQIPAFDLYLSFTGGRILDKLEKKWGAQRALPLCGCVDPDVHARVPVRSEFQCLMSFMGTFSADRQHKVNELFLAPARRRWRDTFVLAGSMYPSDWVQWPDNLRQFDHVSPVDHPALYSSSQFTMNVTRDGMARQGYCPSGRFFEAGACGTPIITDWFEGLDRFFIPGEEIFVVHDTEDVLHTLSCPHDVVAGVAKRARERTLAQHTGDCRARELIKHLESAISARSQSRMEVA